MSDTLEDFLSKINADFTKHEAIDSNISDIYASIGSLSLRKEDYTYIHPYSMLEDCLGSAYIKLDNVTRKYKQDAELFDAIQPILEIYKNNGLSIIFSTGHGSNDCLFSDTVYTLGFFGMVNLLYFSSTVMNSEVWFMFEPDGIFYRSTNNSEAQYISQQELYYDFQKALCKLLPTNIFF